VQADPARDSSLVIDDPNACRQISAGTERYREALRLPGEHTPV
jgi:hypothetical protein